MYLWIASGRDEFREPIAVGAWLVVVAFLLISSLPTLSWKSARPRKTIRLEIIAAVGLVFAALLTEPWWTLIGICVIYIAMLPVAIVSYARVKRQRAARPPSAAGAGQGPSAP